MYLKLIICYDENLLHVTFGAIYKLNFYKHVLINYQANNY